jgi:hypothetical protein
MGVHAWIYSAGVRASTWDNTGTDLRPDGGPGGVPSSVAGWDRAAWELSDLCDVGLTATSGAGRRLRTCLRHVSDTGF